MSQGVLKTVPGAVLASSDVLPEAESPVEDSRVEADPLIDYLNEDEVGHPTLTIPASVEEQKERLVKCLLVLKRLIRKMEKAHSGAETDKVKDEIQSRLDDVGVLLMDFETSIERDCPKVSKSHYVVVWLLGLVLERAARLSNIFAYNKRMSTAMRQFADKCHAAVQQVTEQLQALRDSGLTRRQKALLVGSEEYQRLCQSIIGLEADFKWAGGLGPAMVRPSYKLMCEVEKKWIGQVSHENKYSDEYAHSQRRCTVDNLYALLLSKRKEKELCEVRALAEARGEQAASQIDS